MKIALNWLKDYVALSSTSMSAAAHHLTMAGFEVEAIHHWGLGLEGVVVAQILGLEKHSHADTLSVARVGIGAREPLQVVCGAKNCQLGDKVPLALIGATLPSGMSIQRIAIRGVESFGMLCSRKDLGLAEDNSGLMILDTAIEAGTPIAELAIQDAVIDINVTPNRPDMLSFLGMARELAALTGEKSREPKIVLKESSTPTASRVQIRIAESAPCLRYTARVIAGVKVQPSPHWMRERLRACGVRAINSLVDVTNYVMLEYGQPLHVFDLDRITNAQIVVRLANADETLKTLDGKVHRLDADDLIIGGVDEPLAFAGIMGGVSSEVTEQTSHILLECAAFQPTTVRRSARRHGLATEASYRFERGTDIGALPKVLDRAAALIVELSGGVVLADRIDVYPRMQQSSHVQLSAQKVADVLGIAVPMSECVSILTALGFKKLFGNDVSTTWEVPLGRVDVSIQEDLIEEIARIRGYDAIPSELPRRLYEIAPEPADKIIEQRIHAALASQGMDEVVNYSFVSPASLEALQAETGAFTLSNPLTLEQSVMQTTLYANLVQNVVRSVRHQAMGVRFYEFAKSYFQRANGGQNGLPVALEKFEISGALWGFRDGNKNWISRGALVDFYDARAVVEAIASVLHIHDVTFHSLDSPWYHPRAAARLSSAEVVLGTLGELHPYAQRRLDAPSGIFLFQLDLDALTSVACLMPQARPLMRFPAAFRDFAILVPEEVAAAHVRAVILEVGNSLVEDAEIFDVYTGPQVGEGKKSLAYALRYRARDRTLTDAEVNAAHSRIIAEVTRRLGAVLRA